MVFKPMSDIERQKKALEFLYKAHTCLRGTQIAQDEALLALNQTCAILEKELKIK